MRMDRLTTKSQEALRAAVDLATKRGNPELIPEHLLIAILEQDGGVGRQSRRTRRRARGRPRARSRRAAERRCRASPAARSRPSARRFTPLLSKAEDEAKRLKDDFVSVEHFLLAAAQARQGRAGDLRSARAFVRQAGARARRNPRQPARHRSGSRREIPGAREVHARPHGSRAPRQDRSGHRPRRRDPPRDAGAVAPHQEQPRADRRAGRRQDGHRRRHRAPHRERRRARVAEGQAHPRARSREHGRGLEVPRRIRGSPESRAEGGRGVGAAASSCSSTSFTRWSARAPPKARWTRPTC